MDSLTIVRGRVYHLPFKIYKSKHNIALLFNQHGLSNRVLLVLFFPTWNFMGCNFKHKFKISVAYSFLSIIPCLIACSQFVSCLFGSVCVLVVKAIEL